MAKGPAVTLKINLGSSTALASARRLMVDQRPGIGLAAILCLHFELAATICFIRATCAENPTVGSKLVLAHRRPLYAFACGHITLKVTDDDDEVVKAVNGNIKALLRGGRGQVMVL
jgi:hypothetical protein